MKTLIVILIQASIILNVTAQEQTSSETELPTEVVDVLNAYIHILTTSETLDECADRFLAIAGGGLVNPAGTKLRESVKPYSLKKDFENIKFYTVPVNVVRVVKSQTQMTGYGASAIAGDVYKIFIAKKDGTQPAPVQIVFPKEHPSISTPKITNIGSF